MKCVALMHDMCTMLYLSGNWQGMAWWGVVLFVNVVWLLLDGEIQCLIDIIVLSARTVIA